MIKVSSEFINSPVVSVILCTYNQEKTIENTIDCALTQQCNFPFEIIIGEDCGTDNTRDICINYQKKFPNLIKLILFEKNVGVVNNWLACIKEARGKYLTTCAGDDYWHNPNKLQIQVDFMESNSSCGVLHTDYDELNSTNNKISHDFNLNHSINVLSGSNLQMDVFMGRLKLCGPTVCIRKELFDKYIPVEKYAELEFPIEDWPTWMILSRYCDIIYLPISTVTYRRGHESLSNLANYDKIITKFKREKIMYKFVCDLFPDDLDFSESGYDSYVNNVLLTLAVKKWDYPSAKKYAKLLSLQGVYSSKIRILQTRFGFLIYCILRRISKSFR